MCRSNSSGHTRSSAATLRRTNRPAIIPRPTRPAAAAQVRDIQSSGLLLLGWAARGGGESGGVFDSYSLPGGLVERCLSLAAKAEKLHSMDVAIKSHAGWAKHHLRRRVENGAGQAIVEYRVTSREKSASAGVSTLSDGGRGGGERWR